MFVEPGQCPRCRQGFQVMTRQRGTIAQVTQAVEGRLLPCRDDALTRGHGQGMHATQAQPQGRLALPDRFQRAIDVAGAHIDRQHRLLMRKQIAHQLRWLVEPHGLAVEQGRGERRRGDAA